MTGVPADLLDVLVCPETRQELLVASKDNLESLNAAIERGKLRDQKGDRIDEPIEAALISSDGKRAYRVKRGVADLIGEESIELIP